MNALNNFFFIGLPYIALFVFFVGSILRYNHRAFKVSSLSSEFLEGKKLFWGSVPFHWGIMFMFFGHLIAFLVPKSLLWFNSHPVRLLIIEVSAFMFALSMLIGLFNLFMRRTGNSRIGMVTTPMDITILSLLILQVITGILTAHMFRWGSSWFAAVLTPYLRSIFILQPDIAAVSAVHWLIKLHIIGAFVIILLVPFSRLIHFLVLPLQYLWRPYQRVIWNYAKNRIRQPDNGWNVNPPRNN